MSAIDDTSAPDEQLHLADPGRDRRPAARARPALARRLVAVRARRRRRFVGVHEFVTTAQQLAAARARGLPRRAARAHRRGERAEIEWLLGGFVATFVLAFLLNAAAETRAPTTAAVGSTVLGSAWIGLGLGSLLVLREMHDHGRLIAFTVVVAVVRGRHGAYLVGRRLGRHKLAPRLSPKKTWEGLLVGALAGVFVAFVALYDTRRQVPLRFAGARARRRRSCGGESSATCSSRRSSATSR